MSDESTKIRADVLAVKAGLYPSRSRAGEEIRAGNLLANGVAVAKPSARLAPDVSLTLRGRKIPYVSRGGLKLAHGLDHFKIDVRAKTCLDIGASTGGFTQVLLRRGAVRVFAVDVGHGQLAEELKRDPAIISLEGMDARHLGTVEIPDAIDLLVSDVSFISLTKALGAALKLVRPGGDLIALIKPQFEVGRAHVGKGGIVKDAAAWDGACAMVSDWLTGQGWSIIGITPSPIEGGDGNHEYLVAARAPT